MRKKYDLEFKIDSIRLALKLGNATLAERNLNIGKGCIYKWEKEIKLDKNRIISNDNLENAQEEIIKNLKKGLSRESMERNILKKEVYVYTGFRDIEHRTEWTVSERCKILKMFREGFYKFSKNKPSKCNLENMRLDFEIKVIWEQSKKNLWFSKNCGSIELVPKPSKILKMEKT